MKIAVRLLLGLAVIFVLTGFATACKSAKPKLEDEIARMRQLPAAGDLEALADALDESMARIPAGEFGMGSEAGSVDEQPQLIPAWDSAAPALWMDSLLAAQMF